MNARADLPARQKLFALLEVLFVYALMQTLIVASHSLSLVQWEIQVLGWSYAVPFACFVLLPAAMIWLAGRSWAEYGVSLADWRTNLDIGVKAFLVRFIPDLLGRAGASMLGLTGPARDILIGIAWVIAVALMVLVMNRHRPTASGKSNLILIAALLVFPVLLGMLTKQLNLVVVSTIAWQFLLSGFGEEFAFRGYFQSRLNQAFGHPLRLFGIQFGAGLIVASFLFGLLHAFNTFNPAVGLASLGWVAAIETTAAGLFFGVIREKTGTLLAPGIAHGLPDAVGEPMMKMFTWIKTMG